MAASVTKKMKVHETTSPTGELSAVFLERDEEGLSLVGAHGALRIPRGALPAVMARFGGPLETGERLTSVATLELDGGARLCHVRHLSRFDVIARDYLLDEAPALEPVCALATTVVGALDHLARAASRR
jgi:hypothetical protein